MIERRGGSNEGISAEHAGCDATYDHDPVSLVQLRRLHYLSTKPLWRGAKLLGAMLN